MELKQWIISKTPLLNDKGFTFSTRVYWVLNGITDFPKCVTCGKYITSNASVVKGYRTSHCSNKCGQLDADIQGKKAKTCVEKFGVKFAWQADSVKRNITRSPQERYGVSHPLASLEIRKKYNQTNLEKYGTEEHIRAASVIEKTRQANIRKYGVDNPWKNKKI